VESFRTFIAIELPRELRALIMQHIQLLRRELPDVRASWAREDNLHLTLKFLGDVPIDRISALSAAVARATKAIAPFDLIVSDCGTFPPHGLPKVLWLGTGTHASGVPTLSLLQSTVEDHCAAAGFPREARPYHPHLTIARLRSSKGARRLADLHREIDFPPQSFTVSEVVVFRSELLREGSKHTAISRHPLH